MRSFIYILLVVGMVGLAMSSESDKVDKPRDGVKAYTDEEGSAVEHVSPHGFKALVAQRSGKDVLCYRCTSPCSQGFCCTDGFPQCCTVNGNCQCCSR